jgi:hypothetical protein
MANRVASGLVCDDNLDDEIIEVSSDDTPKELKSYVACRVKQESTLEGQARVSASHL